MCGIAGFYHPQMSYTKEENKWKQVLRQMNQAQKHRGPDGDGIFLNAHCGLAHVRLSIIDLQTGGQPMTRQVGEYSCTITYNGEIYNMHELKKELLKKGCHFTTFSDTEVILAGYMEEGETFFSRLNGIFAFSIWDDRLKKMILCRDRLGVKPLFYQQTENGVVFSSEMKGIFCYPGLSPVLDRDGLCEIFALGPAKSYGKGVFKDMKEVLPGHYLTFSAEGARDFCYWKLQSKPHEDTMEETVEKTSWLLQDAITGQMLSDIPICTFLSGGVDSSLVTAVCAKELARQGRKLNTFSFDFQGNSRYFQANSFQPSQDRPFVDIMVQDAKTQHIYLECDNSQLEEYLYKAVDARDLPCMADVESSLLYFCSKVVDFNKVTLTGECADEIFGGYPWFHKKACFEAHAFPWSMDMEPRKALLKEEMLQILPLEEYAGAAYEKTIGETPVLPGESETEKRRREIAYLNLRWFMVTLLDRMDRTSMYSGLEARVPLADHRIVEYVWNVPWEMKCPDGLVKGLLRRAGEGILPDEVLYRKKSPYPKTYHPGYEKMLGEKLKEVLHDPQAPVRQLIDRKKVEQFLKSPSDYGRPWYGQLMAGPQMLAFLLQVNYWLEHYKIQILL
ncbi:MAG: asparagine synthase (glutamine-hydrolyzing) [Lachnospiraceae bacterium]|jgi:asparagine synthase (glutamine-hydrolysing)